jgi:hypothetical protein
VIWSVTRFNPNLLAHHEQDLHRNCASIVFIHCQKENHVETDQWHRSQNPTPAGTLKPLWISHLFAKIMSFNCLQGAAILVAHATFTKMLVSFTLRTYQYLEWDEKRLRDVESNVYVNRFQGAQMNESEYTGLLVSILLFLSLKENAPSQAATLSVIGQVGYVWSRTFIGYPTLPTITMAVVRYGGLALLASELYKAAFFE